VLILTTFGLDDYVDDALRAGASGFMLEDAPPEEIAAALRIVAAGEALLAPAITRAVIEEFVRRDPPPAPSPPASLAELTPRGCEVRELLARGRLSRLPARVAGMEVLFGFARFLEEAPTLCSRRLARSGGLLRRSPVYPEIPLLSRVFALVPSIVGNRAARGFRTNYLQAERGRRDSNPRPPA